jgi:hypothetical protein
VWDLSETICTKSCDFRSKLHIHFLYLPVTNSINVVVSIDVFTIPGTCLRSGIIWGGQTAPALGILTTYYTNLRTVCGEKDINITYKTASTLDILTTYYTNLKTVCRVKDINITYIK